MKSFAWGCVAGLALVASFAVGNLASRALRGRHVRFCVDVVTSSGLVHADFPTLQDAENWIRDTKLYGVRELTFGVCAER